MAGNIFLKLPALQGASEVFPGQLELTSFSWGLSNEKNVHSGSTTSSSTTHIYNISCTKVVDTASPTIMQACANGEKIATGTLTVAAAGAGAAPQGSLIFDLTEVYISSYTTSASGTATDLQENFSVHFAKVNLTFQKIEGGAIQGAPATFAWNAASNQKS
jgi:type VI secretion system secreted protein Hcp